MKLRVLGSAGAEFPGFRPPAFLVDDHLLLDAGTIGAVLTAEEQWGIRHIFITHAHLDHIRAIPALADNIIVQNLRQTVFVHAIPDVIAAMREHLFNGVIWPDFTSLPDRDAPVISFQPLEAGAVSVVSNYEIRAVAVDHTVPAVGYRVSHGGKTLAYTGDTGPTEEFWRCVDGIDALIVEVSFPDSMEALALTTKHLTSSLLRIELKKIGNLPRRILITHPKPQYYDTIRRELENLAMEEIELLHDGAVFEL
ncbi:3',5'-cyclic-nucleotide phosphodiesterase [Oryzomonas japonica]|uniref:3',5'-cyclic-nucleotide phosphodiesterase n=1 Tax=Oryzomonas japonica TaxID=2603858 RepID=A0A7J4ZTJ4_9BACT|nr:3',5'-cyclic-nucleotide phosphodiesterase [Oryzomonas japonica]KAB0666768.1 3',5'-cyclic-nucleotide phosphodiesterase [Oryzomonas japonica]